MRSPWSKAHSQKGIHISTNLELMVVAKQEKVYLKVILRVVKAILEAKVTGSKHHLTHS
jgi:hypothetical protein